MKIVSVGTLGNDSGSLRVAYLPESDTIYLTASVPSDKRRSDISISTTTGALKTILNNLEQQERYHKAAKAQKLPTIDAADEVSLQVGSGRISIPKDSLESFRQSVLNGTNDEVVSRVRSILPFLNDEAVKDVSFSIYKHFEVSLLWVSATRKNAD